MRDRHPKGLCCKLLGLVVLLVNVWPSSLHFHEQNAVKNDAKLLNTTTLDPNSHQHKNGTNSSQKAIERVNVAKSHESTKIIEEECRNTSDGGSVCQYRTNKNIRYDVHTDKFPTPDDYVTAVVKTAGRYDSLVRLVRSARRSYPKLKFVIIDDRNHNFGAASSFKTLLRKDRLIHYEQLRHTNEGISKGRNVGLARSKTPFIMLLDDDFVFTPQTNISVPLEILTTTNISVVGGSTGSKAFFGITSLHTSGERFVLKHIHNVAYRRIQSTDSCLLVDVTENIFLGKRKDILEVGGWNDKLKVAEHLDLFLKLQKHDKLVGFCPEFLINHVPENDDVRLRRAIVFLNYKKKFMEIWNISKIIGCKVSQENAVRC